MRNDKGQFTKGNRGRPKGTPNKTTKEIREKFQFIIENNIDAIQDDLNELEPKDRVKMLLELSQYVIPKLKATEITTDNRRDFKPIEITFVD